MMMIIYYSLFYYSVVSSLLSFLVHSIYLLYCWYFLQIEPRTPPVKSLKRPSNKSKVLLLKTTRANHEHQEWHEFEIKKPRNIQRLETSVSRADFGIPLAPGQQTVISSEDKLSLPRGGMAGNVELHVHAHTALPAVLHHLHSRAH